MKKDKDGKLFIEDKDLEKIKEDASYSFRLRSGSLSLTKAFFDAVTTFLYHNNITGDIDYTFGDLGAESNLRDEVFNEAEEAD